MTSSSEPPPPEPPARAHAPPSAHTGPARVLHAVSAIGVPSETFIADRMIELDRLGWQAWVAAQEVRNPELVDFPPWERVLIARRLARRLHRARTLLAPRHRRSSGSWWLAPAVAKVRPRVLHAHFGWTGLDALPVARRHGVPLVVGLHGYDITVYPHHGFPDDPPRRPPGDVYTELFREASRVLVVSRFLVDRLRRLGYEREVEVIPSGIRLECFPFRGPRSDPPDYRLAFVGRLVPYKGLDVLLRALPAVVEAIPSTRLEVIGDGPQRGEHEALAEDLGLSGTVAFHGFRPRADVLELLRRSDALVMPSLTAATGQAEGLGNVVKEALAVGLCVAASDSGGIPEAIPPERRDELVPEGDPEALAGRLVALWGERGGWGERAERGRRWVEEAFDWRRVAPRIAAVYRDVAAERAGRGARR